MAGWVRVKAEEVQAGDQMPVEKGGEFDTVKYVRRIGSQVRLRWADGVETLHSAGQEVTVRRA